MRSPADVPGREADRAVDGIDVGGASATGPRPDNQDRWWAGPALGIVSDGIGGHVGGARAAELTVAATARTLLAPSSVRDRKLVEDAFVVANDDVRRERVGDREHMGATLSLATMLTDAPAEAALDAGHWCVAHVGDSPAFVIRGGIAMRVTADHTVPGQMVEQGLLTEAEAEVHPYRNMLLQAIGIDERVAPDVLELRLEPGDAIVLVSDGVSGVVEPEQIASIVDAEPTADDAARAILDAAIANAAHDNVTAVVIRRVASSTGVRPAR